MIQLTGFRTISVATRIVVHNHGPADSRPRGHELRFQLLYPGPLLGGLRHFNASGFLDLAEGDLRCFAGADQ